MEIAYSHRNLQCVELDKRFRQPLPRLEDLIEFTASDEWHYEVQPGLRLEHVLHSYQEWVLAAEQNVFLQFCICNLLEIKQDVFSDSFNGKLPIVLDWELGKEYFTESASS